MKTLFRYTALLVIILAAIAAAYSWAPDKPVEQLKARWAPAPSEFITLDGMQVHLRDEGPENVPVLILLHGTSASLHTWQGWTDILSEHYRVIRMDLPGFGLTGPAPDNNYRIERYSDFVIKMMDRLGIEQAVLGGNSLGGQIAWETADLAPERVSGLILLNAAGYPFEAESIPLGFRLAQIPVLAPLMDYLLPRSMIQASLENVYGHPDDVTERQIDLYYDMARREGNRRALVERFQQHRASFRPEQRLAALPQPALVIWGGKDRLIPPQYAEHFHRDLSHSDLAMFEDLGHIPHEEAPQRTVQPVLIFLDNLTQTTGQDNEQQRPEPVQPEE